MRVKIINTHNLVSVVEAEQVCVRVSKGKVGIFVYCSNGSLSFTKELSDLKCPKHECAECALINEGLCKAALCDVMLNELTEKGFFDLTIFGAFECNLDNSCPERPMH